MLNCMADISLRRVSKNIIRVWIGCSGSNFQPQRFEQKRNPKRNEDPPENKSLYKLILLPFTMLPFLAVWWTR